MLLNVQPRSFLQLGPADNDVLRERLLFQAVRVEVKTTISKSKHGYAFVKIEHITKI